MIRYRYLTDFEPPAPFVYLTLRNPLNGTEQRDVPAQIDTAADRTLLPAAVVRGLGLPQLGVLAIGGVGGMVQNMPTYPVLLAVHDLPLLTLEVVANEDERWVLLGRDVLNAYRMLLDGPQETLGIDPPGGG